MAYPAEDRVAAARANTESEAGQVGEIIGFLSRHGPLGPVAPSHCEGRTTADNDAQPVSSPCDGATVGLGSARGGSSGAHGSSEEPAGGDGSLPHGAVRAGGVDEAESLDVPGGDVPAVGMSPGELRAR